MSDKVFPAYLSTLWRRAGLDEALLSAKANPRITGVTDDSRNVNLGSIFVAVRGTAVDGHAFVEEALKRGAAAVVVQRDWRHATSSRGSRAMPLAAHPPMISVEDPRHVLAKFCGLCAGVSTWQGERFELFGVTGTNGKTTTAYLLRSILQAAGRKPALFGTVEYDLVGEKHSSLLTTPGSLELGRMLAVARSHGADCAVMEVSSHALKQRRVDGLPFRAGIFTNLTGDHLDYHADRDDYLASKRRLFELLERGCTAIVNADDAASDEVSKGTRATVRRYGIRADSDYRADQVGLGWNGTTFELRLPDGQVAAIQTELIGLHNVSNVLAAASSAIEAGIPLHAIVKGVARLNCVPGRLQRVDDLGLGIGVYVDYAHTDAALDNVLSILRKLTRGRLICVFGCGGDRDRSKRPRMAAAVEHWADLAYLTSDNPRTEDPKRIIEDAASGFGTDYSVKNVVVEADRRACIGLAISEARPGDTVLVAGKGHEDYQIIGLERRRFDDVEESRKELERRVAQTRSETQAA